MTADAVVEDAGIVGGMARIWPEDDDEAFVVDDEAIELAVDWIDVVSGDSRAGRRMERRSTQRWGVAPGPVPKGRPDIDRASLRDDERTVAFTVRASHRIKSGQELACEIYPDVFVGQRGRGAYSRFAGMAMQQPGDFVEELPDVTQEWFSVPGLKNTFGWLPTVARIRDEFWLRQHGGSTYSGSPIGPMGPSCPPRRLLTP